MSVCIVQYVSFVNISLRVSPRYVCLSVCMTLPKCMPNLCLCPLWYIVQVYVVVCVGSSMYISFSVYVCPHN